MIGRFVWLKLINYFNNSILIFNKLAMSKVTSGFYSKNYSFLEKMTPIYQRLLQLMDQYPEDVQFKLQKFLKEYSTWQINVYSPINEIRIILANSNGSFSRTSQEIIYIFQEYILDGNPKNINTFIEYFNNNFD